MLAMRARIRVNVCAHVFKFAHEVTVRVIKRELCACVRRCAGARCACACACVQCLCA